MSKLIISLILLTSIIFAKKNTSEYKISIPIFLSNIEQLVNIQDKNSLDVQREKIKCLENSSSNTPFVKNIQFRYKLDDFTLEKHDFKLRYYPKAWGETAAENRLYKGSLKYQKGKIDILKSKILRKRYKLVIKLLHYKKILALDKKLLLVYQDKVAIQRQSAGDINFDFDNLMRDENYITKIKMRLIDTNNQILELQKTSGLMAGEDFTFDTTNFISSHFINEFLSKNNFVIDSSNIYLKNNYLKYQSAEDKYKLETSSSEKIISYIDLEYSLDRFPSRYDQLENHFTAGIGLNIPLANSKKLSINKRKLELLKQKGELYDVKQLLEENIRNIRKEVGIYNSQLNLLLTRGKKVARDDYFNKMINIEGVSPIKLLNIKESIIRTDKRIEEIRFKMNKMYVELLDISGYISKKPLKNYLSNKQEIISQ